MYSILAFFIFRFVSVAVKDVIVQLNIWILLQDSGSEGQRLTEAQAINKSLSNLGNVIMALAQKVSIRLAD
jgi:hypothetical protein